MQYTFETFISLGVGCGGQDMGEYGEINVDLTEDEVSNIKTVMATHTAGGFAYEVLAEKLPETHQKICDAGMQLAWDVVVHDAFANGYSSVDAMDLMREDIASGAFVHDSKDIPQDKEVAESILLDYWREWQYAKLDAMSYHEQALYFAQRYKLEPDTMEGVEVQYYLPSSLSPKK